MHGPDKGELLLVRVCDQTTSTSADQCVRIGCGLWQWSDQESKADEWSLTTVNPTQCCFGSQKCGWETAEFGQAIFVSGRPPDRVCLSLFLYLTLATKQFNGNESPNSNTRICMNMNEIVNQRTGRCLLVLFRFNAICSANCGESVVLFLCVETANRICISIKS